MDDKGCKLKKPPQLVTETSRCQKIVKALCEAREPVAVDAEGVCLGPKGPLTLLQIGTYDGQVYLFDVQVNPDLFKTGGLKALLEHKDIIKIIHGCCGDSGALYHQFAVRLCNVFDPQVGHLLIEERINGVAFPHKIKLQAMAEQYGGHPNVDKDLREEWRYIEDYWSRRPLTRDMMAYAAGDVTALIPEVYETQNRLLQEKGLLKEFYELVKEEIELHIEPDIVKQARDERRQEKVCGILRDLTLTFSGRVPHPRELSKNELDAVSYMRDTDSIYRQSSFFRELKRRQIIYHLDTWHREYLRDKRGFTLFKGQQKFVHALLQNDDLEIKKKARQLQSDLDKITNGEKIIHKTMRNKRLTWREKKWLLELPEDEITRPLYDIRHDMITEFQMEIDSALRGVQGLTKQINKLTTFQISFLKSIPDWLLQTQRIFCLKRAIWPGNRRF